MIVELGDGDGLASEVGVGEDVGVGEGLGDGEGLGLGVGVGVGVGVGEGVQTVMLVVHPVPLQQYCLPPQGSTLPTTVELQILSSGDPSDSGGVQLRKTPSDPGHSSVQEIGVAVGCEVG